MQSGKQPDEFAGTLRTIDTDAIAYCVRLREPIESLKALIDKYAVPFNQWKTPGDCRSLVAPAIPTAREERAYTQAMVAINGSFTGLRNPLMETAIVANIDMLLYQPGVDFENVYATVCPPDSALL